MVGLAKTILTVIEEAASHAIVYPGLQAHIARLRLLRDSTKRKPIPKDLQFSSLHEFIAPLRDFDNPA